MKLYSKILCYEMIFCKKYYQFLYKIENTIVRLYHRANDKLLKIQQKEEISDLEEMGIKLTHYSPTDNQVNV